MLVNRLLRRRPAALAAAATSALALAAGLSISAPADAQQSTATTNSSDIVYHVHPLTHLFTNDATPGAFPSPQECVKQYGLACYTPDEIRTAYDIPDSWTGAGQSIAIIDAYGSPTVQSDLDTFSAAMGIPSTHVNVYCPSGCPDTGTAHKGQPPGWAGETSLDVQWSHAIAPDATINLVVASNNYGNSLNNAVEYAVDHDLGDVMSMSYGADESAISGGGNNLQLQQSEQNFEAAVNAGISLFASSGDGGATDGGSQVSAGYPASSPEVTAVGGTDLFTNKKGAYQSEYTWNDSDPATCPFGCSLGVFGATGGAPSTVFPAPAYQQGVTGKDMRTTSDVSYNAGVYTSVLVYVGFYDDPADNGFYFYGGTSSGSPQWAAIGALLDQQAGHRMGALNPKLYGLAGSDAFHDITVGNDQLPYPDAPGFDAGAGYDLPTGLGSPDVANLVGAVIGGGSTSGGSGHGNNGHGH
ncbi:MAG TPA: S53 family peptidase [Nocardioidaceae bacterium]|nr:S53 family peptidase [Nocardioidaceae bacterium]